MSIFDVFPTSFGPGVFATLHARPPDHASKNGKSAKISKGSTDHVIITETIKSAVM
jgi:hypothetical protein